MQAEGCACIQDMTRRSAMALAAFARIPEAFHLLRKLKDHFSAERYDAAVVIDSPALNLPVAKICRKAGIPVLYYIAPQTWAWGWRRWRNARLRSRVNQVACIWPFEEPHFRNAGIEAKYVGHPLLDRLMDLQIDESRVASLRSRGSPVITLLPGSREHVIREVLPGQLEVAAALARHHRRAIFLIAAANESAKELINALSAAHSTVKFEIVTGSEHRAEAIKAADLALVASGTITLEVMYHGTPMIVMYNTARWPYQLVGRWLISTPYLSLPNILAGREIVPEFMPYYRSTDPIVARAVEWLATPASLERVRRDLRAVIGPIAQPGAADRTAKELDVMIARKKDQSVGAPPGPTR